MGPRLEYGVEVPRGALAEGGEVEVEQLFGVRVVALCSQTFPGVTWAA